MRDEGQRGTFKVHSVRYNFVMNLLLTVLNTILPLITFPYVSRVLGADGYGKVNFAISVSNYFYLAACLGIPTYGIRACAKVRDNPGLLSQTVQEILIINSVSLVLSMAAYAGMVLMVPRLAQDKVLYAIEGINVIFNTIGSSWVFQALEQYDYITIRSLIFKVMAVAAMFLLVHTASDYRIYAATIVFGGVGSNTLNVIRLHHLVSLKRLPRGSYNFRRHLRPIFILFAQSAMSSIFANLDTVMLGVMKNDAEVGYYTTAVNVKLMLTSIVTSLGNVLLPRMSYYVRQGRRDLFERLMTLALSASLLMSLPLSVYFFAEATDSVLFLAGSQFLPAVPGMRVIIFAVIPIGLTGIIGIQVLTALDRELQVLVSVAVGAVADFVLNLALIPTQGATGSALATLIAESLVLVTQLYLARDLLNKPGVRSGILGSLLTYLGLSTTSGVCAFLAGTLCTGIITGIPLTPHGIVQCTVSILTGSGLSTSQIFLRLVVTGVVFFGMYALQLLVSRDSLFLKALGHGKRGLPEGRQEDQDLGGL